jgi:iron complex outermembrane receptor protein
MKVTKVHAAVVAAMTSVGGLAIQTNALAQEGLEEIVVTATRREQNLQEVPISIVAITGEGLEVRGLQNVENLNATIPNLSVMGSAGGAGTSQTSFRVRGIPGVGTYIDGIWQISTQGMLTEDFVDLDRLEVLRGPQGTLFGRESIGGAVRIFTKRPTEEFGATFKGTLGSYNRHDAAMSVNLPLSDTVKTKFTFSDSNRDGYIRSLTTGVKGGGIDQSNLSGDILWTPTDKLDVRATYSRFDSSFVEPRVADAVWLGSAWFPATAGLMYDNAGLSYSQRSQMSGFAGGTVGKWENRSETTIPNNIVRDQATLDVKFALSDKIGLQFLTGATDMSTKVFVDYDNSQWGLVEDTSNSAVELLSQEIQITGGGDRIQWVAGLFYWDQSTRTRTVGYAFEEFNLAPRGITVPPAAGYTAISDPRNYNNYVTALFASPFCQALAANPTPPPGPASTCQTAMTYYKNFSTLNATPAGGRLTESGNDGLAMFGEITVLLTDKLTLAVGARNHDQDNFTQSMLPTVRAPDFVNREFAGNPTDGVNNGAAQLSSFDKSTGRASLQYQFTDEFMGYTSFSRGFNPGGQTLVNVPGSNTLQLFPFSPEIVENFEIGIRSDLANNKVRLNATLFDTTWDNIQVNLALQTCDANNFCVDTRSVAPYNVGNAHARGAELEMILAPTDNLTFNVNIGYLDTGFDDILLTQTASGGTAAGLGYTAGQTEFSQAPEHTYNVGMQHNASLKSGASLTTRFDYSYVSQYWRAADPRLRVAWYANQGGGIPPGFSDESGDFGQFNARLTYSPAAGNWDVALFGTNLTDEYQLNSGFFHGIWGYDFATVGRPREYGASLTFRF